MALTTVTNANGNAVGNTTANTKGSNKRAGVATNMPWSSNSNTGYYYP